ncbi:MAG: tRNA epoxyqueuosine(34) reductase QueG [Bryobacterales bacterium]|jgi:epoxyqueuosine reductase|nr:tRNA epoxyqueuosine(34) reductase QueG [Bryobacterales bacterium]
MDALRVKQIARECGFELAGIAPAVPLADFSAYQQWASEGMAGAMGYLTDYRQQRREDPRHLLPEARSMLCVGKLYHTPQPLSTAFQDDELGWISRYAWGEDYHQIVGDALRRVEAMVREGCGADLQAKVCVDTAPLLERSYARMAGLGWIGKNTCLIHEPTGSWYFLGALLLSLDLEPDAPPPDRCGSCTRCIDACPTAAIVPRAPGEREYFVDARACISYYTIEKKGEIPPEARPGIGQHVFGCDICQDVCPWNRRAPVTEDARFQPLLPPAPPLERLAAITEAEFRGLFQHSPVSRARYRGFLRNVAVAMGNTGSARYLDVLEAMTLNADAVVAQHAGEAIQRIRTAMSGS